MEIIFIDVLTLKQNLIHALSMLYLCFISVSYTHLDVYKRQPLGQSVSHAKFGQGVVLAVEGSGAHTRVQVKFREHGVKWLVLAYANLIIEA